MRPEALHNMHTYEYMDEDYNRCYDQVELDMLGYADARACRPK